MQQCRLFAAAVLIMATQLLPADEFKAERERLVWEIQEDVIRTSAYIGRRSFDERVMAAIGQVPRHLFVPPEMVSSAYENRPLPIGHGQTRPLPIGHGQTISQPYIVALMTDLLDPETQDRVLEIGTGSGYQAAVLSGLVAEVKTLEIIEPLGRQAAHRLEALGYDNIEARIGDGYYGWTADAQALETEAHENENGEVEKAEAEKGEAEAEAFDGIIVTAAASHIPPPLVRQLKPGGIMVIPVGSRFQVQQLTLIEKSLEGKVVTRQVLPVRFVPLTGGH
jgi:protein-L-isoaspartate(D-aspartate) O-methyltransferase